MIERGPFELSSKIDSFLGSLGYETYRRLMNDNVYVKKSSEAG
jgi:hypothetical protein